MPPAVAGYYAVLAVLLLFMPRFSEHEGQLYSATEIVTRLLGQLKIDAGLVSQEWRPVLRGSLRRLCIDDIYIDDVLSGRLLSVPAE